MAVPYTFGSATTSIPLSQLDSNFATGITLGNTAIQLGNTVTTLNNMTYANVTISSVASTFPNNYLSNSSVILGNTTIALGSTASSVGNLSLANLTVSSSAQVVTGTNSITGTTSLTSTAFGVLQQCSGTSADYAVTLPAVSGNAGKVIGFQMSTALTKLVTITGNGAETIDGSNTRVMWAGETAVLYCDGTAWTKIGGKSIPMIAGQTVSATQSVVTGTEVKKVLGTSYGSNCPAAMNDTANNRIVVKRPAVYQIQYGSRIQNATAASNLESILWLNGSELVLTFAQFGTGFYPNASCTFAKSSAVGDYFELYVRQYTGVNQTYGNFTDNLLVATEIVQW